MTMSVPGRLEFFIDPNRCIGRQARVVACSECDTHRGHFCPAAAVSFVCLLLNLGLLRYRYGIERQ